MTSTPSTPSNPVPQIASLAAIVLVGGGSTRMGRPKAWLDFDGMPLLARVVERVRPAVAEIVLVAAPGQSVPPVGNDVTVVRDTHPGEGPLPALALGLATITAPWALAVGCDGPLLRPAVVAHLAALRDDACDAIVPVWNDRLQPLVAMYRRKLGPTFDAMVADGERRLQAVVRLPRVRRVESDALRPLDPTGDSFRSLNTPEEYAAALVAFGALRG
jgi:molybdopterin-guanine dinucleotide biosynthesis protein A